MKAEVGWNQLKQSWICKEKHLHWEEDWTGDVIGKGAGLRSLKWNDRIRCFLLRNKPKQFTKCFNLDKEKLFILNRFRAAGVCDLAEIAPFLRVYFPHGLLALAQSDKWSVKSGWLCCHFKTQWRNLLSAQPCNPPLFSIIFEIMFTLRRRKHDTW